MPRGTRQFSRGVWRGRPAACGLSGTMGWRWRPDSVDYQRCRLMVRLMSERQIDRLERKTGVEPVTFSLAIL